MRKAYIFDVETERENRGAAAVGTTEAAPYCDKNDVVISGMKEYDRNHFKYVANSIHAHDMHGSLLIGHNIPFDLQWLFKVHGPEIAQDIDVYDTMVAEYYLSGQQTTFSSLDSLALKYGGTLKDDKIKKHWEAGGKTSDIPTVELQEYLRYDLINTEIIFKAQIRQFKRRPHLLALFRNIMKSLIYTTLQTFYGVYINTHKFETYSIVLENEGTNYEVALMDILNAKLKGKKEIKISTQNISTVLFGGTYKVKVKEQKVDASGNPMFFKNKNPRMHTIDKDVRVPPLMKAPPWLKTSADSKYYLVDDGVIEDLLDMSSIPQKAREILGLLRDHRRTQKELSTYFEGYRKHIWPRSATIHAQTNHAVTATGRVSGSSPNLLNIP